MPAVMPPLLVACFGNEMAGDDAFGCLVGNRLKAMRLEDVEVANVGMQPFGLLHYLDEDHLGVVVVDASLATPLTPAGMLLELNYFDQHELQLVHDFVLSTHGLSIADELELARRLNLLPPRVHLVTATIDRCDLGCPPTLATERLVVPAAESIERIARAWRAQIASCRHA